MNVTFKYVLETRDGFRQVFDTPEEAIRNFYDNVESLMEIIKEHNDADESHPDYCDYEMKREREYFLSGTIETYIADTFKTYELKTLTY